MFDATPVNHTPTRREIPPPAGPVMSFAPATEIYAEGDPSGSLYQVVSGVVRIYRLLADGRRQICAFHMPGEVFGFEVDAERHFFADAVTIVRLHIIRPGHDVEVSRNLLAMALRALSRAQDHLLTLGRTDALGRVAGFLLEMSDRQNAHEQDIIDLPMSRIDIADYLGLTIETVSRALAKLKEARVIRLSSARQVVVLRQAALQSLT